MFTYLIDSYIETKEQEIRKKVIDEFMEEVKKAYASMNNIPSVEKSTVNTIMLGIVEKMKGE